MSEYRDNNIDVLRKERDLAKQELALVRKEKGLRKENLHMLTKCLTVTALVAGFVATGSGWLAFAAIFLALD